MIVYIGHIIYPINMKATHPKLSEFSILKGFLLIFLILIVSLVIGIFGYRYLENMSWEDSLLNSATTLAAIGPLNQLHTTEGKIFVSIYVIYSSLLFFVAMWILIAPILHHIFYSVFKYQAKDE
jgi:hypothetical protein